MRHIKILALALLTCTNAANVDYTKNGDNWGELFPNCTGGTQSPIDLKTDVSKVNSNGELFKFYNNLVSKRITYSAAKSTNYVIVNTDAGAVTPNTKMSGYFKSKFGKEVFGTPPQFHASAFHVHSPSEHSVDGQLYDLEMHTVHLVPKDVEANGYVAAAVGIIFDTTNYDKSVSSETVQMIDNFFESLKLSSRLNPSSALINYGELMMSIDTSNRWVYKGSVTTPPCAKTVYWNVVGKVYPIKEKHLNYYKTYQMTRKTTQNIKKTGNNRRVQPTTDDHMLQMLTNNGGSSFGSNMGSSSMADSNDEYIGSTVVLAICVAFLLVAIALCYFNQTKLQKQGLNMSSSKYTDNSPIQAGPVENDVEMTKEQEK